MVHVSGINDAQASNTSFLFFIFFYIPLFIVRTTWYMSTSASNTSTKIKERADGEAEGKA